VDGVFAGPLVAGGDEHLRAFDLPDPGIVGGIGPGDDIACIGAVVGFRMNFKSRTSYLNSIMIGFSFVYHINLVG